MNCGILSVCVLLCFSYFCQGFKLDNEILLNIKDGVTGRIFDGIGGLSGGGATSKLLINYKEPYRSQILDYLFKPNFGASLHILKVEIGGDSQSTEGTEPSHMHVPWEENYQRGYEWWLMVEAKKRNPNILLYGLPWAWPGWISGGSQNPWDRSDQAAKYILKWIQGAKKHYNLTIDIIGIWNEKTYTTGYVKLLRQVLDQNGFSHTRMIVADNGWTPAADAMKDLAFKKSFYAIGAHYPGTASTTLAKATGKQLWSSEDYSTFNDDVGAGCWARILNQNYVIGLMTSTISWNLIASYYDALPYKRCSLMTANEPWSGHYELPGVLWVTAHTTQFTKVGWRYLPHGSGVGKLPKGGSYVTLVSPDGKDVTIIIETMSHDHSVCIRPPLPAYNVSQQTMNFIMGPSFKAVKSLNQWMSQLSFVSHKPSTFFKKMPSIVIRNGAFSINLAPDSLITLSTIKTARRGTTPPSPPSRPFPVPYFDNFDAYNLSAEPYNFVPQVGSFEVVRLPTSKSKVLKQTVLQRPIDWCGPTNLKPIGVLGNYNWKAVVVTAKVRLSSVNGTNGAFLATRINQGGCGAGSALGIFFWIMKSNQLIVTGDLQRKLVYSLNRMLVKTDVDYLLKIVDRGNSVNVYINNVWISRVTFFFPKSPVNGWVGLGTDNFGIAYFDDLSIPTATVGDSSEVRPPPPQRTRMGHRRERPRMRMTSDFDLDSIGRFSGNHL